MIETGERLWNGAIATQPLADAYNALQKRIHSFEETGKPVPEYLLNGAHNLIASALPDCTKAIDSLLAINVPTMARQEIYDMRDGIASLITDAESDCRKRMDNQETRSRANAEMRYVESIKLRLLSVTRP